MHKYISTLIYDIYKYKILKIKALPNYCLYTRDYFLKKDEEQTFEVYVIIEIF